MNSIPICQRKARARAFLISKTGSLLCKFHMVWKREIIDIYKALPLGSSSSNHFDSQDLSGDNGFAMLC